MNNNSKPRVILMADGWVGLQMARLMKSRGDHVVALFVHEKENHHGADEIMQVFDFPVDQVYEGAQLKDPKVVQEIRELKPDYILSITWSFILKQEVIDLPKHGAINIHNGLLPYNRGWHSNVWSIIEGTPSGVTLHYIDAGIDTGDVIRQQIVDIQPTDTAKSLYEKLVQAMWELLEQTWPEIVAGDCERIPQSQESGTHRYKRELTTNDHLDLDQTYTGRELINLLRARTFPPHPSAYFVENGKRIYVRVELEEEDCHQSTNSSDELSAAQLNVSNNIQLQKGLRHAS